MCRWGRNVSLVTMYEAYRLTVMADPYTHRWCCETMVKTQIDPIMLNRARINIIDYPSVTFFSYERFKTFQSFLEITLENHCGLHQKRRNNVEERAFFISSSNVNDVSSSPVIRTKCGNHRCRKLHCASKLPFASRQNRLTKRLRINQRSFLV